MAERYDFYVHDNRKITFDLAEPIMREDSGVTDFLFHIPKVLNELEVSDWQWWLVFVNAKKEKYSIALTLSDDPERPLEYNLATYTVDYAMSIKAGSVQFALEAINAGTGGAIDNEWHTLTYETKVKETLQGNQAEYAETESDIISELLQNVRTKVNQLVGGATPEPVDLVSKMTDQKKVYLYTGSETGYTSGHWYYHNGTTFVSGGVYGAGIIDPVPTQGSTNAVSSGGVYDALNTLQAEIPNVDATPAQGSSNAVSSGGVWSALQNIDITTDTTLSVSGKPADAKTVGDALADKVDAVSGKGLSTNDYTDAEKQAVTDATADLSAMTTATAEDVGKALKAKTVSGGKVTEWEFGEAGGADIEFITKRFEKLYADGYGGFDSALFVNGGMLSGVILYGQKYRVTTNELFSFTRDVTISAQNGYRFGVHVFVDGAFDSDSGWKTSLDVSAGTTFKIVIAKQTEDTSVVADIVEFVNAIDISTFVSDTRKQVEQLDEELTGEITDLQSEIDKIKNQGLPASVASAILQTLKGVAWASENGGQMINTLHDALFGSAENYTLYDYIRQTDDHPRDVSGILTTVDFDITCSLETTIYYTKTTLANLANVFGARPGASRTIALFAKSSTGQLGYWYGGKDTLNVITPLTVNHENHIILKPVGTSETYPDNVVIDVDGTEYNTGVTVASYDFPTWLGFFTYAVSESALNTAGVTYNMGLRIGKTIIRGANGGMRNCFVPAYDGTHYGFFDTMNNRFYYDTTYPDNYECGYWD